MNLIDLHVHSSVSDGTLRPAEVTKLAAQTGLCAYALTDHDSIDGVKEAMEAARGTDLKVIPGTELSSIYEGTEIHILGLCLNPDAPALSAALKKLRSDRDRRNLEMLDRLQKDGFSISLQDLNQGNSELVITRAHFARALLEKGYVSSMDQAFRRYLDHGKKYCPPKETISPPDAIRLILESGGFPALAHPIQYNLGWKRTEQMICGLKEMGLMGLEVYYSSHYPGISSKLREIGRKYDLLPTGGSDFHGSNKPDIRLGRGRGGLRVSSLLLDDIEKRLSSESAI